MYISFYLSFTLTLTSLARISSLRQQVCLTLDPTSQCDPPPSVGQLRVQSGNFQSWKQTSRLRSQGGNCGDGQVLIKFVGNLDIWIFFCDLLLQLAQLQPSLYLGVRHVLCHLIFEILSSQSLNIFEILCFFSKYL